MTFPSGVIIGINTKGKPKPYRYRKVSKLLDISCFQKAK